MVLLVLLILCFVVSLALGKYPVSVGEIFQVFSNALFHTDYPVPSEVRTVIFEIRLPRLIACIFTGAALSVSGAVYQSIFRNPMVSPDLLGASSGAALGACISILLSASTVSMLLSAFLFGLLAVGLTLVVSALITRGGSSTTALVLTGIVVSALFNAGVSIAKSLADTDDKLGEITFWLMGSMTHLRLKTLPILCIPVLVGLVPLLLLSWRLNLLSAGDEVAGTLGVSVRRLRLVAILSATMATAASVACCGMIGWIGLVVPHLTRMFTGPDTRRLLPGAALFGALFLMLTDNITRIFFDVEVAIGILTALIGAPFFLVLLARQGRRLT